MPEEDNPIAMRDPTDKPEKIEIDRIQEEEAAKERVFDSIIFKFEGEF